MRIETLIEIMRIYIEEEEDSDKPENKQHTEEVLIPLENLYEKIKGWQT